MTKSKETNILGPARNRVDGPLKVTGKAKYAVEFEIPNLVHAWPVVSNLAKGTITAMDTKAAESAPGVLKVLTHQNAPQPKKAEGGGGKARTEGIRIEERNPLSDDKIHYAGQYVALVVAQTLEQAQYAASLVGVNYAPEEPLLTMKAAEHKAKKPEENQGSDVQPSKGDVDEIFRKSDLIQIRQTYATPTETHNPIELHGTIAAWDGDNKLTVWDSTQFVKGVQSILARTYGLDLENVRVIDPFVGGAFGSKGPVWPHELLATMAAKVVGQPVKFYVPRKEMFTCTGHRTPTSQTITLAATKDGKLQAMRHVSETLTSTVGDWVEACGARSTAVMYASPNIKVEEYVYSVNRSTPNFMRAPGECPGTTALEMALDELAVALKMDPVQLRLTNYAENHPIKEKPFSAKHLKEAYSLGAEKFGWSKRNPQPASMKDGHLLVGWGMATATYPAHKMKAVAKVILQADGSATVQCATHDLGTGAYTAFTQISSEQLGVRFEKVNFELGRSDYPFGPVAGGSNSTATVGTAIHQVAGLLHQALADLAVKDAKSPLHGLSPNDIAMTEPGRIGLKNDKSKSDSYTDILQRAGKESLVVEGKMPESDEKQKQVFQSWGAHFVEVKIDPLLPLVQVTRVVSVIDCGRVVTYKPARSQIIGGVVMGIGMALTEATEYDPKTGLPANANLAEYHVPTNADIPHIEVEFVGEPDFDFNPIGARGIGEIGITGIAAAVANAVFHATGRRVRDLPITPDKLI
ncbi:MAG: xanthine dehydrogenase family protein molybdopterin-binding subunit [Chthoniobacterales bacterium]